MKKYKVMFNQEVGGYAWVMAADEEEAERIFSVDLDDESIDDLSEKYDIDVTFRENSILGVSDE